LLSCWNKKGKVLIAGNGGSAADAMHLAEELSVRFAKNRRALAAIALCDPAVLTCAANDFGFESIFSRQIEALGNSGDVFIALTTAQQPQPRPRRRGRQILRLLTVSFLGKDGGQLRNSLRHRIPDPVSHHARIQECQKLLYHALCEWIESKVD